MLVHPEKAKKSELAFLLSLIPGYNLRNNERSFAKNHSESASKTKTRSLKLKNKTRSLKLKSNQPNAPNLKIIVGCPPRFPSQTQITQFSTPSPILASFFSLGLLKGATLSKHCRK